ncbi:non-homologous end-joining DNA ligase [Nostocoides sp. F2B08]|uniref:non-homologous end-joining DNA ligase n=1 Tax=Nostocoides sp. F2B08 TaxID=2653936 RepID=UPI00351A0C5C
MSISPMLATRADRVPTGPGWVHEIKWDGMRVLADIHGGHLTLTSRLGNDVTPAYPELAPIADLYDDALLDAEIVAFDGGRPSFAALAERMHVRSPRKALALSATRPVTLMVFDLLRLFGSDLTAQPWRGRRELLERLEIDGRHWQVPPTYDDGVELHAATAEQGLEGVVSKRRDSPYAPGRRSADWLKVPHRNLVSAVVGGWRPETGSSGDGDTARLGAVLVGVPGADGLRFIGRVGSGLAGKAGIAMRTALEGLATDANPFLEVPREDAVGARWVRPELVVDVRALGESSGGRLRQPSYIGIRPDLTAADVMEVGDA